MRELIAVAAAFALIPILSRKKLSIGTCICLAGVLMAVVGGLGFSGTLSVASETFTNFSVLQQLMVVAEISVLGHLLKKYGIMDRMITALLGVFKSPTAIMMSVPALVGLLGVPGGAIISAPFLQEIGEKYEVDDTRCAVINLIFRHVSMHVTPYVSSFLLTLALVPDISLYKLIGLNAIFSFSYVLIGYFLYIRDLHLPTEVDSGSGDRLKCAGQLFLYASPIYTAVLLNMIFSMPFYLAMLFNFALVFLMHQERGFLRDIVDSFRVSTLFSIVGVFYIQGVISRFPTLTGLFSRILADPGTTLIGIILAAFFFGISTGFPATSVGVVLPILLTIPMSEGRFLLLTHTTFCWGFLGYYFSPLHLCQLFTCDYMKVSTPVLYRQYIKLIIALSIYLPLEYFLLSLVIR